MDQGVSFPDSMTDLLDGLDDIELGPNTKKPIRSKSKIVVQKAFSFKWKPRLRLRNLRCVMARSLHPKPARHLVTAFFTLHRITSDGKYEEPFYTSETISNTLNPSWTPFEAGHLKLTNVRELNIAGIRIWRLPRQAPPSILFERIADFNDLVFLGDENVLRHLPVLPPNTLLFQMSDGTIYTESGTFKEMIEKIDLSAIARTERGGEPRRMEMDKTVSALRRMKEESDRLSLAIKEGKNSAKRLAECLVEHRKYVNQARIRDAQSARISALKKDISAKREALASTKLDLAFRRKDLLPRSSGVREAGNVLASSKKTLALQEKSLSDKLEETKELSVRLSRRRHQMLKEIYDIFAPNRTQEGYVICGCPLPPFDPQSGRVITSSSSVEEEKYSASLGYLCTIIETVSRILEVPLRFPLKPMASRSTIFDFISFASPKEAEFPLYPKSENRNRYQYGVDLLNANLEELLHSRSLRPDPPKPPAYSVHNLLLSEYEPPLASVRLPNLANDWAPTDVIEEEPGIMLGRVNLDDKESAPSSKEDSHRDRSRTESGGESVTSDKTADSARRLSQAGALLL